MTGGVEKNVLERFAAAGVPEQNVCFARDNFTLNDDKPPAELVHECRSCDGPTMNVFDAVQASGRADDLQRELEALHVSQNTSANPDTTRIDATFLRVTVSAP